MNQTATARRILLVGMMGSGKSTVGRILAERLGVPFHDNDELLRQQVGGVSGEMQATAGTDALHAAEAAALHTILAQTAGNGAVIGVAASTILDPAVAATIRGAGSVVWLNADAGLLANRLSGDPHNARPSFGHDMATWLRTESQARAPLYADVATTTVDVDDLKPWQVAQLVLDRLGLQAFGWLPGSFEGVVLDLDGLLVDTEVLWEQATRNLFAERGLPYTIEDHDAILGSSEEYTVRVFARRFGVGETEHAQILRDFLRNATDLFAQGVPRRPGAMELVESLRGRVPLGLASNTRREIVTDTLLRSGLSGCFDVIVTGDEAEPKPAPGIYLEVCHQLGIDPARSVAVEDSRAGTAAAKAAGMTCIGVPSDPEHVPVQADCLRTSLLELIEAAG